MQFEPALPIVSFVDDKKSRKKMQSTLEKRQKKRKLADNAAYRIENKEPVGLPNTKKTESASKKRKLSDDSLEEAQDDNFETMMPDSSDEEGGENSESGNESDASDGENPAKKSQKTEKAPKDTKARLAGAISALLGDDTTPAKASASVSSAESDSDVDEDAMDAVPILSDVRKTSAQRRAEKKAAKDAERVQRELRLQRKLLKNKDHVVLDGQTNNVEKEVRLRKIGTKGVVKLFNAIRSAQKEGEVVTSTAKTKKQKEKGEQMTKEKFLELLQRDRSISADDAKKMLSGEVPAAKPVSVKSETADAKASGSSASSWKVLRDDYLLGARMKDWDKEHSDDEENEKEAEQDMQEEDEYESE